MSRSGPSYMTSRSVRIYGRLEAGLGRASDMGLAQPSSRPPFKCHTTGPQKCNVFGPGRCGRWSGGRRAILAGGGSPPVMLKGGGEARISHRRRKSRCVNLGTLDKKCNGDNFTPSRCVLVRPDARSERQAAIGRWRGTRPASLGPSNPRKAAFCRNNNLVLVGAI